MFTWSRRCRHIIHTVPVPYSRTAYCTATLPEEVLQQPQEEQRNGRHVINLLNDGNLEKPELQIRMYGGAKKRDLPRSRELHNFKHFLYEDISVMC